MDKLKMVLLAGILLAMGSCTCSLVRADELDKAKEQLKKTSKEGGYTVQEVKWVNQDPAQIALLKKALAEKGVL